jgi:hypothetical protein
MFAWAYINAEHEGKFMLKWPAEIMFIQKLESEEREGRVWLYFCVGSEHLSVASGGSEMSLEIFLLEKLWAGSKVNQWLQGAQHGIFSSRTIIFDASSH